MRTYVTAGVIAYLLGSIPFGLILVKLFRRADIRATGSGNIGAANVARMAPGLGALTLRLDVAKGYLAIGAARLLAEQASVEPRSGTDVLHLTLGWASLCAVLGHVFPVWLKFKGAKG